MVLNNYYILLYNFFDNWYFKFNLGTADDFGDLNASYWQQFTNAQVKFPFKVRVFYTEKLPGKQEQSKEQLVCRDMAYFVDVPIDPRDVLPDFLLEDSVEVVNDTIKIINEIEPILDDVIKFVGVGCIGSFGLRFVTQLYRRIIERWEIYECQALNAVGAGGGESTTRCGSCSVTRHKAVGHGEATVEDAGTTAVP